MEGGQFSGERTPARPGPSFEPPADPGAGGPSVHGLSLVARIMRGRELAAEAAGIPPLDSDQVLDLQRTAGNLLTSGALARWVDALAVYQPAGELHVSCTAGTAARYEVALDGVTVATAALAEGDTVSVRLPPGRMLRLTGPDGTAAEAELPAEAPVALALGDARFVAIRA
jgi:hypothetical protein